MKNTILKTILGCFLMSIAFQMQAQMPKLSLADIEGKWYIKATNFPMWLNGKKTEPTFNYTILERKGEQILFDEVRFLKKGKQQQIVGYDYPQNDINTQFIWRGKGLLAIAKSKWEVILMAKNKEWAVIQFEKTLFTPAGIDIIFREKTPDKVMCDEVLQMLLKRKIIANKQDLKWL